MLDAFFITFFIDFLNCFHVALSPWAGLFVTNANLQVKPNLELMHFLVGEKRFTNTVDSKVLNRGNLT